MSAMWGWVNVYKDGRMDVGEYSKRNSGPIWNVNLNSPPAEVKKVMAMLDFMGDFNFLDGGSNRSTHKQYITYYIYIPRRFTKR